MKRVTELLNKIHLARESSVGDVPEVPTYGTPLVPSINLSSAYAFETIQDLGSYHADRFDSVRYARDSSTLVRQLERYFSALHENYSCLMFNSGMAALSACFESLVDVHTTILTVGSFYRKNLAIFRHLETRFGVNHLNYPSTEELIDNHRREHNCLIFIESPSNPFMRLGDVATIKREIPNSRLVYDITLQGLLNGTSLYRHADYIISSCTKYIGGHNDVLGGVVACKNEERYEVLWEQRSMRGGIIDNFSAYLLFRSLRTYDLRLEKAIENTEGVLRYLQESEQVSEIFYPGRFANAGDGKFFERFFSHGGAVITFRANRSIDVSTNIAALHSTKMAPSFGSVDSLIETPMHMSHWGKAMEEVEKLGLDSHTIRLSVGNEPLEFILQDLDRLLLR